jgi:hypothetical protein
MMTEVLIAGRHLPWNKLEWEKDPPAGEWDRALARLSGHPLQLALWGEARRLTDGTNDRRLMALRNYEPIWLATPLDLVYEMPLPPVLDDNDTDQLLEKLRFVYGEPRFDIAPQLIAARRGPTEVRLDRAYHR